MPSWNSCIRGRTGKVKYGMHDLLASYVVALTLSFYCVRLSGLIAGINDQSNAVHKCAMHVMRFLCGKFISSGWLPLPLSCNLPQSHHSAYSTLHPTTTNPDHSHQMSRSKMTRASVDLKHAFEMLDADRQFIETDADLVASASVRFHHHTSSHEGWRCATQALIKYKIDDDDLPNHPVWTFCYGSLRAGLLSDKSRG